MDKESLELTGLQMEYSFLREQFLKRVGMRHQVVELTLTIAAAFLGLALTKEVPTSVAFVFPPIAVFLTLEWTYIDTRQLQTIKYLMELEKRIPELKLGWEEFKEGEGGFRYAALSHSSIFLFTQLMAIFIGCIEYDKEINNWIFTHNLTLPFLVLLSIDVVCLLTTVVLIWRIKGPDYI
ncbi:MAG TPA: hypothetical protein PLX30_06060 [Methanothrix sp.]|nr:hypothetical protein [Methanothrix sp.]